MGRRLLLALGMGPADGGVVTQAAWLARLLGAEVVLAHGLRHAPGGADPFPAAEAGCRRIQAACREAGAAVSDALILRFEEPTRLVLLSAREVGADLIVLGAERGLGAVARGVLRAAHQPVWLARGGPVRRVRGPAELWPPLWDRLPAEDLVLEEDLGPAKDPDDLLVLDLAGVPVLSRLAQVGEALGRIRGPLLVLAARRRSGSTSAA